MRIRRAATKSGAVPAGPEGGSGSSGALGVLEPPATPEHAADRLLGSLEAMFQEIAFGDAPSPARAEPEAGPYNELWQLSLADPQTGLANRMLLLDRLTLDLARVRRHGGCVVVSHIDVRNLKDINDDLGYTAGNAALRGMARRLTGVLRSEDTVSRVGETALVAVMTVVDASNAGLLTQRLQLVLDDPVGVEGRTVHLSADLGTVLADPAESAEQVLARAGVAA